MTGMEQPRRRPGRPRSDRARRAILDATLQVLAEQGFEGLSVEEVVARAGVGKATLYRRWASKDELVAAALASIDDDIRVPDTGSVRGDLRAMARDFVRVSLATPLGAMIGSLLGRATSNPELMAILWRNNVGPRRAIARQILERGVRRGEIRPDVDLDLTIDMLAGTMVFRFLSGRLDFASAPEVVDRLIDTIWPALTRGDESRSRERRSADDEAPA